MVVVVLEHVSVGTRGKLSRWMVELKPGVFVGSVSARVRDKLWEELSRSRRHSAACLMLASANNEQGFTARTAGELTREIVDYEGLLLVQRKPIR